MYLPFISEEQRIQKSIYQNKICLAIAIRQDNKLVLTGCDEKIIIQLFKKGVLKQYIYLNQHAAEVSTLSICRKNFNIVSGSLEGSIVIKANSQIATSKYIQKLKGHDDIKCLVISSLSEDLLVSGSRDNTIKIWYSNNQQYSCSQTIYDHNNCVCGLSINDSEDQIISCSLDCMIFIINKCQENQIINWIVYQKIQLDQLGYRISYINNSNFVFQPESCENSKLYIYSITKMKNFAKSRELSIIDGRFSCYYFFPSYYNGQKQILICKNKNNLNVIKVQLQNSQNIQLKLEQAIDFGDSCIFGTLSFDGEYLITWDENSRQIQVRKYQEMLEII